MRKYRIYDKKTNTLYNVDGVDFKTNKVYVEVPATNGVRPTVKKYYDADEADESLGPKDIHGNLIFTCDILRHWNEKGGIWEYIWASYGDNIEDYRYKDKLEIIGNIHQDDFMELIKK